MFSEDAASSRDGGSEGVVCSVCRHPLANDLYRIRYHSLLGTAVCAVCSSALEDAPSLEPDTCVCCRAVDAPLLYTCCSCDHEYCSDCLELNLTSARLKEVTGSEEDWACLACDPSQIAHMVSAAKAAARRSIYSSDFAAEDAKASTVDADRLSLLREELRRVRDLLDDPSDKLLRLEEICAELGAAPTSQAAQEELAAYVLDVETHFDIIQHQESELVDELEAEGLDVDEYRAEIAAAMQSTQGAPSVPLQEHTSAALYAEPQQDYFDRTLSAQFFRSEEELARAGALASSDPLVITLLAQMSGAAEEAFPDYFLQIAPKAAILAFISAFDHRDRQWLAETYSIPPVIQILLKYTSARCPAYFLQDYDLHPLIKAAVWKNEDEDNFEFDELLSFYEISRECDDLGDVQDILKEYGRYSSQGNPKVTERQMRETLMREDEKLKRNALASVPSLRSEAEDVVESRRVVGKRRKGSSPDADRCVHEVCRLCGVAVESTSAGPLTSTSKRSKVECSSCRQLATDKNMLSAASSRISDVIDLTLDDDDDFVAPTPSRRLDVDSPAVMAPLLSDMDSFFSCTPEEAKLLHLTNRSLFRIQPPAPAPSSHVSSSAKTSKSKTKASGKIDWPKQNTIVNQNAAKLTASRLQADRALMEEVLCDSDDNFADSEDEKMNTSILRAQSSEGAVKKPQRKKRLSTKGVSTSTKIAVSAEKSRRQEQETMTSRVSLQSSLEGGFVVNPRRPEGDPELIICKTMADSLKDHQKEGIHFIFDNTIGTLSSLSEESTFKGTGCILAHCMGLGKTFSVIAYTAALLTSEFVQSIRWSDDSSRSPIHTVLVIAPKNTVSNWVAEYHKWTPNSSAQHVRVWAIDEALSRKSGRLERIERWSRVGGVMVMTPNMFLSLVQQAKDGAVDEQMRHYLVCPGPDIVVVDEAHTIKNVQAKITAAMRNIRTAVRIALTGSPIQNNLIEYHTMVSFVKPNLLGSIAEFRKLFVVPIAKGSHADADQYMVRKMKNKTHVLHRRLKGVVQRKDSAVLEQSLPPRREFVIVLRLTGFQKHLYKVFSDNLSKFKTNAAQNGILRAYQIYLRLCSHPGCEIIHYLKCSKKTLTGIESLKAELCGTFQYFLSKKEVLTQAADEMIAKAIEVDLIKDIGSNASCDSDDDEYIPRKSSGTDENIRSSLDAGDDDAVDDPDAVELVAKSDWWRSTEEVIGADFDFDSKTFFDLSAKLNAALSIIALACNLEEKVLLFTNSLDNLALLALFLKSDWGALINVQSKFSSVKFSDWNRGEEYLQIDGSVSNRKELIDKFASSSKCRLFLISTKAGNMGINLQAASRVIVMDSSWNPVHDLQAIFRAYRYGQTKTCFVYRLVSHQTMESAIYKLQVSKQALSNRVVDDQMPHSKYSSKEKSSLMVQEDSQDAEFDDLDEHYVNDVILGGEVPDLVLADYFKANKADIVSIEDHLTSLRDVEDEHLNAEEQEEAEAEYQQEIGVRAVPNALLLQQPIVVDDRLASGYFLQKEPELTRINLFGPL